MEHLNPNFKRPCEQWPTRNKFLCQGNSTYFGSLRKVLTLDNRDIDGIFPWNTEVSNLFSSSSQRHNTTSSK